MNRNRTIVIGILLVVAIVVGFLLMRDIIVPMFSQPSATGVPTTASLRDQMTQTAAAVPTKSSYIPGIQRVVYVQPGSSNARLQEADLYESCTAVRGIIGTPTPAAASGAEPTAAPTEATMEPNLEATTGAAPAGDANFRFFRIVGAESEACYVAGEVFFDDNAFNIAVGVSKSIDGEIAVDMNNVANSQIGEVVVNISEFTSDRSQRDGFIRRRFLESNNFPLAHLRNARPVGLAQAAYAEGETLEFQIVGDLTIRDVTRQVTFDATGKLEGDTLVITARANAKMTDFGFDPPNITGNLRVNDDFQIVLNLVAREGAETEATQPS